MQQRKVSAFSLIEISIVILIIGILVAGVTSGSKMLNKATLSNARTFTQSTSVHNLQRNILLWLDATSETAIPDSEQNNATAVSAWTETRPTTTASTATSCAGTAKPQYITSGLNGLPALQFDGTDDCMLVGAPFYNTSPATHSNFSVFVVAQTASTIPLDTQASSGTAGVGVPHKYLILPSHGSMFSGLANAAGAGIAFGTNGIYFYEHASLYFPPLMASTTTSTKAAVILQEYTNNTPKFYLNGTLIKTGLASTRIAVPSINIGGAAGYAYGFFQGSLGEIIIFDKVLNAEERADVFKYLKTKWKIS
ncbi:MAG: prepilin-type N-terminal cleavage/methylation domain-containing protein [Rickettsiales bacterium]|nr:prepilin-type N-terminal cleavage/methylation domain-containing protein [Rickettsiales bacterium]